QCFSHLCLLEYSRQFRKFPIQRQSQLCFYFSVSHFSVWSGLTEKCETEKYWIIRFENERIASDSSLAPPTVDRREPGRTDSSPYISAFLSGEYLVSSRGLNLDQLVDRNIFQPELPHFFHVIGVDAHRFHLDQLVRRQVFKAHRAHLLDVIFIYPHRLQFDHLLQRQVVKAQRLHRTDEIRIDPHRLDFNQIVRRQLAKAQILRLFGERGGNAQRPQAEQLIQRQLVISERFQFIDIARADV